MPGSPTSRIRFKKVPFVDAELCSKPDGSCCFPSQDTEDNCSSAAERLDEEFRSHEEIRRLAEFKIRRVYSTEKLDGFELIGFSDAGSRAYEAAVYLKLTPSENARPILVASETKVATIKMTQIPRLELLGTM